MFPFVNFVCYTKRINRKQTKGLKMKNQKITKQLFTGWAKNDLVNYYWHLKSLSKLTANQTKSLPIISNLLYNN
jgi:hypothetical protein|tara:strand:+ start:113 stop:334 length:222 start_codon:yes stop_codon:yes gene_type:complete